MATLHHYPLCPHSRFIRLVLSEYGLETALVEERVWERRREFLELNTAGTTPVFREDHGFAVPGAGVIAEYLDETRGLALAERRLLPEGTAERVEVRRLLDWFNLKFHEEITGPLVLEKVMKRFMGREEGGGSPEMSAIRAARSNVRYHLRYIAWLTAKRNWLAGSELSYADLAAAAHLSCVDYLGDVPWDEDEAARAWYARIKSRPSFRPLLNDRVPGMAPSAHYDNLDF
ncbi:glutathione S-transferase family protein [Bosea sp. PAMC 26642]|uniref:glutathione S-transferase family protein n=1 Tax=Bosea sp. (strain PAMC 26642) TaxID=1792307 RepID=UPI00076FEFD1|nr:glutathione S-transferase family protein [Bosea sp. PAMC 26642]AMJ62566.1 glutathione S-transferase [Bosea sp. PAMC 26642]